MQQISISTLKEKQQVNISHWDPTDHTSHKADNL